MEIIANSITLSGKTNNKGPIWTSSLLKKSDKEPTQVLEKIIEDLHTAKDPDKLNQKALDSDGVKREGSDPTALLEKQNEDNVVNEHHYGDKGTNETQLNNDKSQRCDEYYSSGLSLFTKKVYPTMRERLLKNQEFYNAAENKDRVGEGDVVSAGAKEVKVVRAGRVKTWEDCLARAEREIARNSTIFNDAMANIGQIPDNVKHTRMAREEVAAWIAEEFGIPIPGESQGLGSLV